MKISRHHATIVLWANLSVSCVSVQAAEVLERVTGGGGNLIYVGTQGEQLFLAQQDGSVKLYEPQTKATSSFLNMAGSSGLVYSPGSETGLLGIAFDPNYVDNGYFYTNTTQRDANKFGNRIYTEISRFKRSTSNPAIIDPGSRQTIIEIPKNIDVSNHNAGWIGFGKDGMLYIPTGDGGSGGDPTGNAQNGQSLLGKILRLDVRGSAPGYAIPTDNPFANGNGGNKADFRDEIWAYGLRNPFRAGFDSKLGDLYIGDVGQNLWEEVDHAPLSSGGLNFGWNLREGRHNFGNFNGDGSGLTDPIYEYGRGLGQSVIGGTVFRGGGQWEGWYVFSDFYNGGKILALPVDVDCTAVGAQCPPNGQALTLEYITSGGTLNAISGFSSDFAGNLYISDYDGDVFKLATKPIPLPPAAWLLGSGLLALVGAARKRA